MPDIQEILKEYQDDGQRTIFGIKNWLIKKQVQPEIADHAITEIFLMLSQMSDDERKESVPNGDHLDNLIYLVSKVLQKDFDKAFVKTLDDRIKKYLETATVLPPAVPAKIGYWRNLLNAILDRR